MQLSALLCDCCMYKKEQRSEHVELKIYDACNATHVVLLLCSRVSLCSSTLSTPNPWKMYGVWRSFIHSVSDFLLRMQKKPAHRYVTSLAPCFNENVIEAYMDVDSLIVSCGGGISLLEIARKRVSVLVNSWNVSTFRSSCACSRTEQVGVSWTRFYKGVNLSFQSNWSWTSQSGRLEPWISVDGWPEKTRKNWWYSSKGRSLFNNAPVERRCWLVW